MTQSNSPLQEIICCMGLPTSGNPSQFVLERAAAAARLDIRCLTVDVDSARLEQAILGASAMGFRGIVLADTLGRAAFTMVSADQRSTEALGAVDLICRRDSELVGAHSLLLALGEWLSEDEMLPETALIFGCGTSAQAAAHALAAKRCPRILLAQAAGELPSWASACHELSDQSTQIETRAVGSKAELRQTSQDALVIDASEDGNQRPKWFDPLELSESATFMDLGFDPPTSSSSFPTAGNLEIVDGLEMLARRYDAVFRAITGTAPDRQLMRESIEEFFLI